jgi:DNA polymerase III subunit epsilon
VRLVAFDVETTGTNPEQDRIVEISFCEPRGRPLTLRVNPGVPIPPAATRVHGIRDEDVARAPTFADVAAEVEVAIEGAVLVGYNSRSFDTIMLDAELRRAGRKGLALDQLREVDVLRLWHALEPRTLEGATRRWLGREHEGAHSSAADVTATLAVLDAMMAAHALDHDECVRRSVRESEVDRAGKIVRADDGRLTLNFGKDRGRALEEVDPGYLEWMLKSDFPESTKRVVARFLHERLMDRPA